MKRHREWTVSHGRRGFAISIYDRRLSGWLVERVIEGLLDKLGHPCCGRGIGRIPSVAALGWDLLSWANQFTQHDVYVTEVPITREQALIIQPSWAEHDWVMEGADPYDQEGST